MGVIITRISVAICLSLGLLAAPTIARDKPLTAVADLRYGTALYNYYLDDYMAALTELLVAEEQRAIEGHGDNPKIMEGGLAMGYNMERYASEIFEHVLEENRTVDVRDAAWFYLARLRYANQDWSRAQDAINYISAKPAKKLREDADALKLSLLLKQGQTNDAAALLESGRFKFQSIPYFYFNIGSAFAREQDYARAVEYFEFFIQEEFKPEEYRALYDKAMTASGYAHLFLKQYAQAKEMFSRVRLTSVLSNRALLGYGWAAAEMGDYKEALKPWQHLADSALIDENNQEALIAVPYAYEKLGSEGLALASYKKAESSFNTEISKIDEVLATLQTEELLTALQIEQNDQLDWMNFAQENQLSPRLAYLVGLFSQDRFQGSVQELQDLLALRDGLKKWQEKLYFYATMLDSREVNRSAKAEYLQVNELAVRIEEMNAQRASLSQRVETVAAQKDYFALASKYESDLIERVIRSEKNVEKLRESDPFIDEYEESVKRYKGLLLWQASEDYGDRLWQLIKTLNRLDESLKNVSDVQKRVDLLMENAPDLEPYRIRMASANTELDNLLARIERAIGRNENDLKGQVISILREQRSRLSNYLSQSRLSVARLYDKALQSHQETEFEQNKADAIDAANKTEIEKLESENDLPTLDKAENGSELSQ